MVKKTQKNHVEEEPGAEERFMRGVRKALKTPPTKHADEPRRRPKRNTKEPRPEKSNKPKGKI
jgi:hypothetical protein